MDRFTTISRSQRSKRSQVSHRTVPFVTPKSTRTPKPFRTFQTEKEKETRSVLSRNSKASSKKAKTTHSSQVSLEDMEDASSIDSLSQRDLQVTPCPKELNKISGWIYKNFRDFVKIDKRVLEVLFNEVYPMNTCSDISLLYKYPTSKLLL